MVQQLPLGVQLKDNASFANYFPGDNQEALQGLVTFARNSMPGFYYLWGGQGVGKSHLLQAMCQDEGQASGPLVYLPMAEIIEMPSAMLQGLEFMSLVCLDDVQLVCGNHDWEEALFHLYNRVQEQSGRLVVAADVAPAALSLSLPDLKSRLSHGITYHLHSLDDAQKAQALQQRAKLRGFELPDDVATYLLKHCPRDMEALFQLFDRLDLAALAAQRRLTIPFVRQFIDIS